MYQHRLVRYLKTRHCIGVVFIGVLQQQVKVVVVFQLRDHMAYIVVLETAHKTIIHGYVVAVLGPSQTVLGFAD